MSRLTAVEKMEPVFFSPQKVAESFCEVDMNFKGAGTEKVVTRWLHAAEGSDLYIWTDSRGEIVKQQVVLQGLTIEWNILDGLRTGIVLEEELTDAQDKPSERVIWDKTASQATVHLAMTLLPFVKVLEDSVRLKLIHNFQSPSSISRMPAEEVVRRFGIPTHEASHWTSFWAKLQKFLRKVFS
ncbi:MAG: hypothetical protein AB7F59_09750 [Bdellovibrionales bacterium]